LSSYSNPQLPQEEVNVSEKRPLTEFLLLVAGLAAVIVVGGLLLLLFAQTVAVLLPFSAERTVADRFFKPPSAANADAQAALQKLADVLAATQGLPRGVTIQVHYSPLPVANASAMLGGHVTIHRGLLESIGSENALALVLAHEIAHVRHRDPVASLGRGLALAVVLSAVSASAGSRAADWLLGNAGAVTALGFSHAQESRADADALAAVARHYGHVAGADEFFVRMQGRRVANGLDGVPAFMRTHPVTAERIEQMARLAADRQWRTTGELTPLPPVLAALRASPGSVP